MAAEFLGGDEGGAAAAEEVGDRAAGRGECGDEAFEEFDGFLGGVAVAFFGHGIESGDGEDIIGIFVGVIGGDAGAAAGAGAAHGFGGARDGDGFAVEVKAVGLGVEEDGVVLAGETVFAGAAGLVVPDEFVLEMIIAEDLVAEDFGVVDGMPVEVEEEAAGGAEEGVEEGQAGVEPVEVLVAAALPAVDEGERGGGG